MSGPQRVIVLGSGGAGKSTFSRCLASLIEADHVEIDALAFEGRNQPVDFEILHERLTAALSNNAWVLEGMHRHEIRLFGMPACDVVVWLDTPRRVVAFRLVRRLLGHLLTGKERHGRRIHITDLRDEARFVVKTLRKYEQRRGYARELLQEAQAGGVETRTVRSRLQADALLAAWDRNATPG